MKETQKYNFPDNFKPGQLVTVNRNVYRCKSLYPRYRLCGKCDIALDCDYGLVEPSQATKICVRCRNPHMIFKLIV